MSAVLFGLLVWAQSAWAFYSPQTGRWLSRDPAGEKGGINLYVFAKNDAVDETDLLGLASNSAPGVPHVSNDRHNNYLIFQISCPAGFKVSHVRVDYNDDAMIEGLLGPQPALPRPRAAWDSRRGGLMRSLDNSFGGLQDAGRPNCLGSPVEVHAWMRTRLVSSGWQFALWRASFALPDPESNVGLYQENTTIYYTCDDCCGRGGGR